MTLQKYCIEWDQFESSLSRNYSQIRQDNNFSDVTLVSDDEDSFPAHKFVLAGSSSFFQNILRRILIQSLCCIWVESVLSISNMLLTLFMKGRWRLINKIFPNFCQLEKSSRSVDYSENQRILRETMSLLQKTLKLNKMMISFWKKYIHPTL